MRIALVVVSFASLSCVSSSAGDAVLPVSPPLATDVGIPVPAPAVAAPPASSSGAAPRPDTAPGVSGELQRAILAKHAAKDIVSSLTTEVGARLAGSAGDKLAVAWALKTMRDLGLTHVHSEPVTVPVWQRGVEMARIVGPTPHTLAITALGWSGATPPGGVTGDVVRFDSVDALKAADKSSVAGKLVFLDVRMHEDAEGPGYGVAVVARSKGPAEAAKKGALAVVIRSIGSDRTRFPHTGAMHREADARHAIAAGALSNADADLLERVLAAHGSARLALTLTPRWLPDAQSANVVGEVVGQDLPGEAVILGAHLDSWDLGEGAIDDGAGCGIVLEAGRAIAALGSRPRRTVRVVLFAAEENSLAGGTAYAKAHKAELGTIVAALEADSGTNRVAHVSALGGPEVTARLAPLVPLLAPLGVTPVEGRFAGADISPLHELGVPVVELDQDPARYFDTHHTANDTLARVDGTALSQAAAAFATAAWTIANLEGDLGRAVPSGPSH